MEMLKKPYEISLWEDALVFIGKSGALYEDITKANEEIVNQYYKEIRLCTIGSNTMDTLARCVNPKLVRKVNGENILTFTMYYQYIDTETGEKVYNPFIPYMVNERKVKLKYNGEWYDFLVKQIQENSETKAFTYTCKDQFVNELSKSGFELVLDNELENNMGTITKLATTILEGSDWKLDEDDTSDLKQYKEEPLYKVQLGAEITATNMLDKTETVIAKDERIYVFYSSINDKKSQWQFLYTEDNFKVNDDLLIDREHPNYIIDVNYEENGYPGFIALNGMGQPIIEISTSYRGERLVRQTQTKYDSTIDKYVGVYKKEGEQYYGYSQSEYITSGAIVNYVANPSSFISTSGWQTDANHLDYKIKTWPEGALEQGEIYQSFIEADFTGKENALVMNSGIGGNRSVIEEFVIGEKYVLRMKYKNALGDTYANTAPIAKICEYELDDNGYYITKESLFDFSKIDAPALTNDIDEDGNYINPDRNYIYMLATCSRSVSKTELANWDFRVGLFFDFEASYEQVNLTSDQYEKNKFYILQDENYQLSTGDFDDLISYYRKLPIYIEDIQVFPYEVYDDEGERLCVPGGKLHSEIKTKYIYYKPNPEMKSINDLKPVYSEYTDSSDFEQLYGVDGAKGNEFTKVRSISEKESNRFNLIQKLCETFECWPKFRVERDQETGEIKYDENYRQQKYLSFREYVGKENFVGFRYGINSKSIQRTIDSAAIVSKMIVKDNANEFAPNGFCSIARAAENPTGENFLLNFDHYVRQGLLDFDNVTNDLYVNANGYLGYYQKLKQINIDRDKNIDKQAGLLIDISNFDSAYTTYKTSYDKAIEEQLIVERDILYYTDNKGKDFDTDIESIRETWQEDDKFNSYWAKWCQYQNIITQHKPLYEKAKANLDSAKAEYEEIVAYLKDIATQKQALALWFYKKYSRFIQEGSWIKEDYTDPNLYYLDSESTLHTSAQPKVTYNISVIDVSSLAEYVDYEFDIGDRTYIEDTEFFGWSLIDRSAPYREEIVVSEITTELDSPEKDQIKVQNYKTQFEDLFQRITAQTQQAEYHTGEYKRAASVVETNGTISPTTLENSFANNSFKLSNARDQSVVWDSSGITTTSLSNPSEMVRIISGGVFLSNDGGQSWKTGITGSGINTSYLTAGQINTNEIYIMNGNNAAFRWDEKGLSAYWANKNNEGQTTSYNTNKFVRFDHNGLYGVIGEDSWVPASLDDIQENAPFALTWKGFSLKNDDGSVRISTDDDIVVKDGGNVNRVKIGRIGGNKTDGYVYGIRISDNENRAVMETDSNGELWLRNRMRVGTVDTSTVEIGYLDKIRTEAGDKNYHAVIRAGNEDLDCAFSVYEDGYVFAKGMEVSGIVNALEGKIGDVEIADGGLKTSNITLNNNGLIIKNSGIKLEVSARDGAADETVFSLIDGKLSLKGEITATNATFEKGTIGGFTIAKGKDSEGKNYDKLVSSDEGIILDGISNEIKANTIYLGTGAEIVNYIKLGNAYIRNPINNGNLFIESGNIEIYDNGTAKFGDIEIDGINSKISGGEYGKFSITPSEASFENVTVSGKIKTTIFEQGSVQTAGGMILVRPATRILVDGSAYRLENSAGFNDGDYCEINGIPCKIKFTPNEDGDDQSYTFTTINGNNLTPAPQSGDTIVNYGKIGNVGISINSSANDVAFPSEAITIFEVGANTDSNTIDKTPRIILGDLGQNGKNYGGLTGYGLYAENAYLHGALVTEFKDGETFYSGFNGKRPDDSTEPYILLWAGAKKDGSTGNYDIDDAPFRVDSEGNLHATKGTFSGSVISNSTIEATEIVTATLRGKEDQAALTIYDKSGIVFAKEIKYLEVQVAKKDELSTYYEKIGDNYIKTTDETLAGGKTYFIKYSVPIFSINSSGLKRNDLEFISISDSNVSFSTGLSTLTENRLEWGNNNHGISYANNIIEMGQVTKNLAKAEGQGAASTPVIIKMQAKEFMIGPKMRYEPTENGCDLYVL